MPDVVAAIDETGANALLHDAENALGTLQAPPLSESFGPLTLGLSASASFSGGATAFTPPTTISIDNCMINYSIDATLDIDLSFLDFCIPQVCIPIPCVGNVCTPQICIDFPNIPFSVPFSSSSTFSADFELQTSLVSGDWDIDIVILSVPSLDLGAAATALLEAIMIALSVALDAVPLIGPFLGLVVDAIAAAFGVAEVAGLLGDLLTPLVSGLTFNLYRQPQLFEVIPANGPLDPAVFVTLTNLAAVVEDNGKPELVVSVDI